MGSVGNKEITVQVQKQPSEYVKTYWGGMKTHNINGVTVTTNYNGNYPLIGHRTKRPEKYQHSQFVGGGYSMKNPTDAFNQLVNKGYNLIRFVETSTRVKGYHDVIVWFGKQ